MENAQITTTAYTGGTVYENGSLKFISQAEGYIEPDGAGWYDYIYQYKDHLGNVRLLYADSNGDGLVDNSEIRSEKNYYPFGLQHKGYNNILNGTHYPYGFNGKEEQTELDLNWLDFGARNYDPALGRWMNLDPLAEDMRRHSPYNYAFNNPIYYIDPDGMAPFGSISDDEFSRRMEAKSNFEVNGFNYISGNADGGGNSGPGDPPRSYKGPGVAIGDNVVNVLDEVVVTGESKSGYGITTDGIIVWGVGGRGTDSRAGGGIVTGTDRGSGSINVGGSDINPIYGLIWWIMSRWFPKDNTPEPNESTMEQQPEEELSEQIPYNYFLSIYKNGKKDYVDRSSKQTDGIEKAKSIIKQNDEVDSIVIKPFYLRAARKNQLRTRKDTTITRN